MKIKSNNLELAAQKILTGFNENEVILIKKNQKILVFLRNFSIFSINLYFLVIFVVFNFM